MQTLDAVDPMAPGNVESNLQILFYLRRFDEVLDLAEQHPSVSPAGYYRARSLAEKGNLEEAIAGMEASWERSRKYGFGFGALAGLYVRGGRPP